MIPELLAMLCFAIPQPMKMQPPDIKKLVLPAMEVPEPPKKLPDIFKERPRRVRRPCVVVPDFLPWLRPDYDPFSPNKEYYKFIELP